MRRSVFIITLAMIGPVPGLAQGQSPSDLPPIYVLGKRAPEANDSCGAKNGTQKLNCLNRQMRRQADHVNAPVISAPLGANSPDIKIGIVNLPAVQQQYGQNFGKSVIPFRPPPLTFAPALGHH